MTRELGGRRRQRESGTAKLKCDQQHLHGGVVMRMAGTINLDDQPRHSREITRALFDAVDEIELGELDRCIDAEIGTRAGIEIENDRQRSLASDRLEILDQLLRRRRATGRLLRGEQVQLRSAGFFREMSELDCDPKGGMRDPGSDWNASIHRFDRLFDERFTLFERKILILLRFNASGNDRRRTNVLGDVVNAEMQRFVINPQIVCEWREWRDQKTDIFFSTCHALYLVHPRHPLHFFLSRSTAER